MSKESLWNGMKEDLDRWARQGGHDKPEWMTEDMAQGIWEMMQKREEQSYGR